MIVYGYKRKGNGTYTKMRDAACFSSLRSEINTSFSHIVVRLRNSKITREYVDYLTYDLFKGVVNKFIKEYDDEYAYIEVPLDISADYLGYILFAYRFAHEVMSPAIVFGALCDYVKYSPTGEIRIGRYKDIIFIFSTMIDNAYVKMENGGGQPSVYDVCASLSPRGDGHHFIAYDRANWESIAKLVSREYHSKYLNKGDSVLVTRWKVSSTFLGNSTRGITFPELQRVIKKSAANTIRNKFFDGSPDIKPLTSIGIGGVLRTIKEGISGYSW